MSQPSVRAAQCSLIPHMSALVVISQAVRAPALDRDQTALLTKLFNELDRNGDGKLVRRVTATAAKPERSAPRCHRCRSCCPASLCVHVCLQDIDEFKLFGKAISGKEVTDTQARCVQCVRVALPAWLTMNTHRSQHANHSRGSEQRREH